jgi:hypothetical protein
MAEVTIIIKYTRLIDEIYHINQQAQLINSDIKRSI